MDLKRLFLGAFLIVLAAGVPAAGGEMKHECVLTYTNGDTVRGFLTGIVGGRLAFSPGPWKVRNGTWAVKDGRLTMTALGGWPAVYAEVDQTEAITMVAKVKDIGTGGLDICLLVFSDVAVAQNPGEGNVLWGQFWTTRFGLGFGKSNVPKLYHSQNTGRSVREAVLRFAYDPKTGKVRAWLDAKDLGEYTPPLRPVRGKYVLFQSRLHTQTEYIQVLRGVVPPSGAPEPSGADEAGHTVESTDGTRVLAKALTMTDGRFAIETASAKLDVDAKTLSYVVFRKKGREIAPRRKGDVEVVTSGGRLTLQLKALTDAHLVGTSGTFGDVKLPRDAIESIRFHLDAAPSGKTPGAPVPSPRIKVLQQGFQLRVK